MPIPTRWRFLHARRRRRRRRRRCRLHHRHSSNHPRLASNRNISDRMSACQSSQPNDVAVASCAAWCKPTQLTAHCTWCKCRACNFCPGASALAAAAKALLPPHYECAVKPPPRNPGTLRLTACGPELYSSDGAAAPVVLSGVNMYFEWMLPPLYDGKAAADVANLRSHIPSANLVRFVGILWKDSIKESDGVECSIAGIRRPSIQPSCAPPLFTPLSNPSTPPQTRGAASFGASA